MLSNKSRLAMLAVVAIGAIGINSSQAETGVVDPSPTPSVTQYAIFDSATSYNSIEELKQAATHVVVVEIVDQPRQIESEDVPRTLTPATVVETLQGSLAVGDLIDIERYEELGQHMRIDGVNPVALVEGKRFLLFLSQGDASDSAFAFTDQAAAFEQLADGTFQRTYEVPTKLESVVDLDSLR